MTDLHCGEADPPGGAEHENPLPATDAGPVDEGEVCRAKGDGHACGDVQGHVVWHAKDRGCMCDDLLSEAASLGHRNDLCDNHSAAVSGVLCWLYLVAALDRSDCLANRDNGAAAFRARDEWQRRTLLV